MLAEIIIGIGFMWLVFVTLCVIKPLFCEDKEKTRLENRIYELEKYVMNVHKHSNQNRDFIKDIISTNKVAKWSK